MTTRLTGARQSIHLRLTPVPKKPESLLQAKIRRAIHDEYRSVFEFKTHGGPFQRRGLPDIIGCIHGCFVGLEVKIPGRELDPLQQYTLGLIRKSGGIAGTAVSVPQTLSLLRRGLIKWKRRVKHLSLGTSHSSSSKVRVKRLRP